MPIRTIHPAGHTPLETYGAGVPVVFLHGLTFDRRTWRPIIDRLGSGVRSIAIDLPGHGDSPGTGTGGRLEQLAKLIANTVESACGVRDPIIVGHSMSGALGLVYASTLYRARRRHGGPILERSAVRRSGATSRSGYARRRLFKGIQPVRANDGHRSGGSAHSCTGYGATASARGSRPFVFGGGT